MTKKPPTRVRDSVTGQFVPPSEATRRPRETEVERVKLPTRKK